MTPAVDGLAAPAAHTSLLLFAHTARSPPVLGLGARIQAEPFQCSVAPMAGELVVTPTAQTSSSAVSAIAVSCTSDGAAMTVHDVPSK
jgi:hypothetical protein